MPAENPTRTPLSHPETPFSESSGNRNKQMNERKEAAWHIFLSISASSLLGRILKMNLYGHHILVWRLLNSVILKRYAILPQKLKG